MATTTLFWALLYSLAATIAVTTPAGEDPVNMTQVMTDEQRLHRHLMVNYDPFTRPVFNASHTVVVKIGITLTQIFDLDEKNQVLTTNVWLDHEWTDERMRWKPEDYNDLRVLRIPSGHIWKPDIVLYNSVEDYTDGYMQALAMISHDSNVFWPPIVKFHSTCQIDITYFPFDDQVCGMKLGSWAYDGLQVDVVNRSRGVDLSNYVSNGEWLLLDVVAVRSVVHYACCPHPFPDVRFIIYLRRRTLYYTYNVLIPCIMLSTLTLLVFWMSPESGEKITLGLTVLLAFSVFMLLIAENMPATSSNVPLIGIYLTSGMALTSMSVILAVFVSNINNRGHKDRVMPPALRRTITLLACIIRFRLNHVTPPPPPPPVTSKRAVTSNSLSRSRMLYRGIASHVSSDSGCGLMEHESSMDSPLSIEQIVTTDTCTSAATLRAEFRRSGREEIILETPGDTLTSSRDNGDPAGRPPIDSSREREGAKGENLCRQWQEAAEVIDRCLFWVFVMATLAVTLTCLIILPLTKKPVDPNVDIFKP